MDTEFVSIAGESCREMLHTAGECFRQAGECLAGDTQEDEWLQFYMRGKCGEKAHPGTLTHCLPFYFKVGSLCVRPLLYNRHPQHKVASMWALIKQDFPVLGNILLDTLPVNILKGGFAWHALRGC